MNQKSNKHLFTITLVNSLFCLTVLVWLFAPERKVSAQGPPQAFLGPIYYGSNMVTAIFDHDRPLLSEEEEDGNDWTQHYDGSPHNSNPPFGMGYDEHDGIDYDLNYEIVLAAAGGTVDEAGWSDPSDHTYGLGLRVKVEHNNGYITEYGHLSVLQVSDGDQIQVDPDLRHGIIGISGSTGSSTGSHLHFGLMNPDGIRVNPYGWIGAPGTDPWELDPNGAPSYNVWDDYPSIIQVSQNVPLQFTDGDEINDPGVNNARMIIDDGSADFFPGSCWTFAGGSQSYNNGYYRAPSDGEDNCTARWTIRGDAFTQPGEYDVFAYIPTHTNPSLSVAYDVHYNNQVNRAIAVQAAYVGNEEHDAWVYLGRYDFAMSDNVSEFILVNDHDVFDEDSGRYTLADAIMLAPADGEMPLPQRYLYVSFASSGYAGNVPYENEDILLFDTATGEWRLFFDGSDVGLSSLNVDAAEYRNGDIYFSVDQTFGSYRDSDIIRFNPTSLGDDTSGSMTLALAGSPYLTKASEDVDALSFMGNGYYLLSTIGEFDVPNVNLHDDEDIFSAVPSPTPAYSPYLDGSMIGLGSSTEDVDALWLDTNADMRYLSTEGSFVVSGSSGDGADVIRCQPGFISSCAFVAGLFWNGSAHGMANMGIDALYLGGYIPLPGECGNLPLNCSFEELSDDEEPFANWTVDVENPLNENWLPTISEYHSGWYSALAEAAHPDTGTADLISSPITIEPTGVEYRFSFYAKAAQTASGMEIEGAVLWYNNNQFLGKSSEVVLTGDATTEWEQHLSQFICPLPTANTARFVLDMDSQSLQRPSANFETNDEPERIFVDDVKVESRLNGSCPTLNSGGD